MRYFIVILLAIGMIALPLHVLGSSEDCCGTPADAAVSVVDGMDMSMDMGEDCCCLSFDADHTDQSKAPDRDDDSDRSPCDDGNCPASCCAGVTQTMLAFSGSVRFSETSTSLEVLNVQAQRALPQPHLQRLKRPPRVV
tara:strand:+ start:1137 stop:1553 length:417 start_codon:yes stop_codon:yes gene_type:complete